MRHDLAATPTAVTTAAAVASRIAAGLRRLHRVASALLFGALLAACTGDPNLPTCVGCFFTAAEFYAQTRIIATPSRLDIAPTQGTSSNVVLVYSFSNQYRFASFDFLPPAAPGLTIGLVSTEYPLRAAQGPPSCTAADFPDGLAPAEPRDFSCLHFRLDVTALAASGGDYDIVLSAQFRGTLNEPPIERLGSVRVAVAVPPTPDFTLALGTVPKIYAPRGSVPIVIQRTAGFSEDIALTLAPVSFPPGAAGTFAPTLVAGTAAESTLNLDIPANNAEGNSMLLRVTGTSALTGKVRTRDFTVAIESLFRMALSPGAGTVASNPPFDVLVTVTFDPAGPYAAAPPAVRFSLPPAEVPAGVQYQFLEGDVATTYSVGTTIRRTLRLITDGRPIPNSLLPVVVTATLPPDSTRVFSSRLFQLSAQAGFDWEYVENGASYSVPIVENSAIGIALQSNNKPAIAWLEGPPGTRTVYLKRFDGTTFVASPSPGPGNGLTAGAGGTIEQARMALSRSDAAHVAFTYQAGLQEGAAVAVGSLGNAAGASWSASNEFVVSSTTQHARSPRIATPARAGQAMAISYVVEEGLAPVTASELFVRWTAGPGALQALPGPGGGSVNAASDGRVLPDSPSLALRPDGKPWVAWIEQPADRSQPPVLWLRGHDGVMWGAPRQVPTVAPPLPGPTQLLVEPSGAVVVAWLEARPASAFPAQLLLARLDPASGTWTALTQTGNDQGSLNIRREQPVRDMSLAIDALGRLVVAWCEEANEDGTLIPRLWAKRQSADGSWPLLGMVIDTSKSSTPFVVGDSNSRLYVAWRRAFDITPALPRGDVFVARWVFP